MATSRLESLWKLMSENTFEIDPDSLNDKLTCVICKKIVIDPFVSNECGCHYCSKCIKEYINGENKCCPGGKEDCNVELIKIGENVVKSGQLNRQISKVKVRCLNQSCMCNVELIEMEDHLRVCLKQQIYCPYFAIGCTTEKFDKQECETHLHYESLPHSKLLIEIIQNLMNEVNLLKESSEKSKPEMVVLKEESRINKDRILILENELRKLNNEMISRLEEGVENIEREMNENRCQQIEVVIQEKENINIMIDDMNVNVEKKKIEIESIQEDAHVNEDRILLLEKELNDVKKEMNEYVTTVLFDVRKDINKMMEERKRHNQIKESKIGKVYPTVDYDFVWRVEECSRKIDKDLCSESFYANDYKFSLSMCINSVSDYVYLCCCVMKSDNDEKLRWPMKHAVTLSIVDQMTLRKHKTKTHRYDTYKNDKRAFDRPGNDRNEYRIGSPFIKYSSITNNSSIILGDCMVVSCVVSID